VHESGRQPYIFCIRFVYARGRTREDRLTLRTVAAQECPLFAGVGRSKPGYTWDADLAFVDVDPTDYAALVIPGGRAPEEGANGNSRYRTGRLGR
jgi:putative intracellular protease/amidase